MRLIDADKFLSQIEDQYMEHDISREKYMDLEDRIMQQPTIEERKIGKWVWLNSCTIQCDQCHYRVRIVGVEPDKFCPNCGADMRGEEE